MVKNERLVGYALYFFNYSTWEGRVLFLEDLFVRQQYRSETIIIEGCLTIKDIYSDIIRHWSWYSFDERMCQGNEKLHWHFASTLTCTQVAKTKDCRRMVWQVLDSNTKAFDLYERIGGKCLREWLTIRMDKKEMEKFISSSEWLWIWFT